MQYAMDYRGAENRVRREIAECTRILACEGIMDYSGHVSARLPDGDMFLIQPFAMSRREVRPEDLVQVDLGGQVRGFGHIEEPPSERFIHSAIYSARPDVKAVLHCHPETAIMFTLARGAPLVPLRNHASRWAAGIPVHPDPAHIDSAESGAALARTLGDCHGMLIRAHGVVVTAESVPCLLADAIHFEENARAQLAASQLGPITPLTAEEMVAFLTTFDRRRHAAKLWDYYTEKARAAGVLPQEWNPGTEDEQAAPAA